MSSDHNPVFITIGFQTKNINNNKLAYNYELIGINLNKYYMKK